MFSRCESVTQFLAVSSSNWLCTDAYRADKRRGWLTVSSLAPIIISYSFCQFIYPAFLMNAADALILRQHLSPLVPHTFWVTVQNGVTRNSQIQSERIKALPQCRWKKVKSHLMRHMQQIKHSEWHRRWFAETSNCKNSMHKLWMMTNKVWSLMILIIWTQSAWRERQDDISFSGNLKFRQSERGRAQRWQIFSFIDFIAWRCCCCMFLLKAKSNLKYAPKTHLTSGYS